MKKHLFLALTTLITATLAAQTAETTPQQEGIDLVLVEGGTFKDQPVKSFKMSKYEITNAQFAKFLKAKGNEYFCYDNDWKKSEWDRCLTYYSGGGKIKLYKSGKIEVEEGYENHPVTHVTWYGARAYAQWVGGRLPTDTEWSYAAYGGKKTQEHKVPTNLDEVAWHKENAGGTPHPVGTKKPNALGLYDMWGNVSELLSTWDTTEFTPPHQDTPTAGTEYKFASFAYTDSRKYIKDIIFYQSFPNSYGEDLGFRIVTEVQGATAFSPTYEESISLKRTQPREVPQEIRDQCLKFTGNPAKDMQLLREKYKTLLEKASLDWSKKEREKIPKEIEEEARHKLETQIIRERRTNERELRDKLMNEFKVLEADYIDDYLLSPAVLDFIKRQGTITNVFITNPKKMKIREVEMYRENSRQFKKAVEENQEAKKRLENVREVANFVGVKLDKSKEEIEKEKKEDYEKFQKDKERIKQREETLKQMEEELRKELEQYEEFRKKSNAGAQNTTTPSQGGQ